MVLCWRETVALKSFAFTFASGPHAKLCFDKPVSAARVSNRPFKRRRPLWDVDGGTAGRKKRRLRLNLVTSRLSRPFSVPTSNIVNRGVSRIARWAKGKHLDTYSLRKSAIMNRVRNRLNAQRATARREQDRRRNALTLRQMKIQLPRNYDVPLPPSPLGLSNYDALDLEDEMLADEGGGDGCTKSDVYSDFNVMRPMTTSEGDEYDYLDELDGIPHDLPEERPIPLDDRIVDIIKEKERQRELCFVKFVT